MTRRYIRLRTGRRRFLQGVAGTVAAGALTQPALADDDRAALEYTPVWFGIYLGSGDDPDAFGYPENPFPAGMDDRTYNGFWDDPESKLLFDSREIERDDDRLRHILKFRQDETIVGEAVPYTLEEHNDVYRSAGSVVDFSLPEQGDQGVGPIPLNFLPAPADYRAVFRNGIKLYEDGGTEDEFKWAYTRVDWYSRADERYIQSAVYAIWDDELEDDGKPSTIPVDELLEDGRRVIEKGPLPYEGLADRRRRRKRGGEDDDRDDEERDGRDRDDRRDDDRDRHRRDDDDEDRDRDRGDDDEDRDRDRDDRDRDDRDRDDRNRDDRDRESRREDRDRDRREDDDDHDRRHRRDRD